MRSSCIALLTISFFLNSKVLRFVCVMYVYITYTYVYIYHSYIIFYCMNLLQFILSLIERTLSFSLLLQMVLQ